MQDYRNEYKNLISELEINKEKIIHANFEFGYFILSGEIHRRDILLKVAPVFDIKRVEHIFREAVADGIIERHNQDLKKPFIFRTKVLEVGQNQTFAWIIRRYYKGMSLADPTKDFQRKIPDRFSLLQVKYLKEKNKVLTQVIDNIESIQSLETDFRRLKIKKSFFEKRFLADFSNSDTEILQDLLDINLLPSFEYFTSNKGNYFSGQAITATISDLTPANLIIRKDGRLYFSDFEWFCFDNSTLDVAFFWLFLWRHPSWQKKLVSLYSKNNNFYSDFRLSLIRIILTWYLRAWEDQTNKGKDFFRNEYKDHAWTRYLEKAYSLAI